MWQYQILETGFFYADGGAMFGVVPKVSWSRKYPSNEQNTCLMAMRCLLVWNDYQVMLLDTGVGNKDLRKLSYYQFHQLENIVELVRGCGFEPEQVTDVVLSHLHFDHCGGCTHLDENNELKVTFPKATHWVGRRQWDVYKRFWKKNISFRQSDMMLVAEAGMIQEIDSAFELSGGFKIDIFKGHTHGQLVSFIETNNGLCIFPGDVIPTQAHLSAGWVSAYDTHPIFSDSAKQRIIKIAESRNAHLIFYHDAYNKSFSYNSKR
jgi:glyoxylase-like metal-dependent hydrolase (beta-lactamase superfamily II)